MEVTNLLDIHTREELYAWYLANHDKVSGFWIRVNRAKEPYRGVVGYVDAVEVALCFGWIDSTQKRIDDGKPVQHFTPRSKRSNWCWNNIERCRRLIDLGEMTPAGLAVLPDHNPDNFIYEQWVVDALKVYIIQSKVITVCFTSYIPKTMILTYICIFLGSTFGLAFSCLSFIKTSLILFQQE